MEGSFRPKTGICALFTVFAFIAIILAPLSACGARTGLRETEPASYIGVTRSDPPNDGSSSVQDAPQNHPDGGLDASPTPAVIIRCAFPNAEAEMGTEFNVARLSFEAHHHAFIADVHGSIEADTRVNAGTRVAQPNSGRTYFSQFRLERDDGTRIHELVEASVSPSSASAGSINETLTKTTIPWNPIGFFVGEIANNQTIHLMARFHVTALDLADTPALTGTYSFAFDADRLAESVKFLPEDGDLLRVVVDDSCRTTGRFTIRPNACARDQGIPRSDALVSECGEFPQEFHSLLGSAVWNHATQSYQDSRQPGPNEDLLLIEIMGPAGRHPIRGNIQLLVGDLSTGHFLVSGGEITARLAEPQERFQTFLNWVSCEYRFGRIHPITLAYIIPHDLTHFAVSVNMAGVARDDGQIDSVSIRAGNFDNFGNDSCGTDAYTAIVTARRISNNGMCVSIPLSHLDPVVADRMIGSMIDSQVYCLLGY